MPPPNGIQVYVPGLPCAEEPLGPERVRLGVDVVAVVDADDAERHRRALGHDEGAQAPRPLHEADDHRDHRAARIPS